MEEGEPKSKSLLAQFFGLHPLDAYEYSLNIQRQMQNFVDAFKQRIEVEINYSKSLFKISKLLVKYVQPDAPSPLSYICSAFKVENEQRARHSLQLAEYLHTEIEVVCLTLLQRHEAEGKKLERELKKYYKEGETIEQTYQKNLKRFVKCKQTWQERMINKSILFYTPGVSQSHKDKMVVKLQDDKRESDSSYDKYVDSLEVFNEFAGRYNGEIQKEMQRLEQTVKEVVTVQADCMRKLIVSQVNMFKNIEYDLLNISKQMESLKLQTQIQLFVNENKQNFVSPILTIYNEGPIIENSYQKIDYKQPINHTLMEQTLMRIENKHFDWMLENKSNSTLRYAMERIWKGQEATQKQEENDYLKDFQEIIKTNRVVRQLNVNNDQLIQEKLRPEQAYSISLEILHIIAHLCSIKQENTVKDEQKIQLLRSYFALHHFYRFIASLFLEEYQNQHDNKIQSADIANNYSQIVLAILTESFNTKDVFVIRGIIAILFGSYWEEDGVNCYLFQYADIAGIEMWENIDFWEAAVFEASYQQISLLPGSERTELREVYLMLQKNAIFSGLVTFTHYMVMLGLEPKEVRRVLGRYCQIYNLNQEHERDLVKTINNSQMQYKETSTPK